MKILLAASEVAPIIKLGGLGDVIGSLPKALEKLGVECDVIAPYFPFAKTEGLEIYKSSEINVPYAGENNVVSIYTTKLPKTNVSAHLIQNEKYFSHYGSTWKLTSQEELTLFSFFDRAVVEYIKSVFNIYDLVHCNDWHTGLITHLLEDEIPDSRPATLFTVHNLMYQGVGDPSIIRNVGIVPGEHMLIDWDVADGDLNMIQQGISSADFVSTVSPTYMKEILTPEYGGELCDILLARIGRTQGILNGLDYASLPRDYDETDFQAAKLKIKTELLNKLRLSPDTKRPLFAFVGRLDPFQKGIDLIYSAVPEIIEKGGSFVLLGTGDSEWEGKLKNLAADSRYKAYVSMNIAFDNELARKIYSGSDFLLVPSRYEPCGLIQMLAMWYGSLPIVRATGGLKDSVKEGISGFLFDRYSVEDMLKAVGKAFGAFNGQLKNTMVATAMKENFSWDRSAVEYKELYKKVIQTRINDR